MRYCTSIRLRLRFHGIFETIRDGKDTEGRGFLRYILLVNEDQTEGPRLECSFFRLLTAPKMVMKAPSAGMAALWNARIGRGECRHTMKEHTKAVLSTRASERVKSRFSCPVSKRRPEIGWRLPCGGQPRRASEETDSWRATQPKLPRFFLSLIGRLSPKHTTFAPDEYPTATLPTNPPADSKDYREEQDSSQINSCGQFFNRGEKTTRQKNSLVGSVAPPFAFALLFSCDECSHQVLASTEDEFASPFFRILVSTDT